MRTMVSLGMVCLATPIIRSSFFNKPFSTKAAHSACNNNLRLARLSKSTLQIQRLSALDSTPPLSLPLPTTPRAYVVDLISSTNSVICISDFPYSLTLFNPTTGSHRKITPTGPTSGLQSHWVDFGLAFDRHSDDFTLLRIDQLNGPAAGSRPRKAQVFTLKDPTWKTLEAGFPHFLAHPKGHGKYLHNALHFMATLNSPNVYDSPTCMQYRLQSDPTVYRYVIVTFDVASHGFTQMPLPKFDANLEFPVPSLVILGGNLAVQIEYGPMDGRCVEVWMMNEYGAPGSWVKLLDFPYIKARPDKFARVKPVAMHEDKVNVLMEQGDDYFWYNLDNGSFKDVLYRMYGKFMWFGGHPCDFRAVVYEDNPVSLT